MSDLLTQPITIAGLPACPTWCPDGHKDGDRDDRVHEKVIASFVAVDADSHEDDPRPVNVELFVQRYDTVEDAHLVAEPISTRGIVEFVHEIDGKRRIIRASMTAKQLRQLAVGTFLAAKLLDEAKDDDEFACCDTNLNCVHAQETEARIAAIRAAGW
ncbi:MAG: hypothetical protein JWO67_1454 [Streptosporangiaceae bacterium]|nr:hypothetical protein [Streptosporangiaceae bacterium]